MSTVIHGRIAALLGNFALLPFFMPGAAAWFAFEGGSSQARRRVATVRAAYGALVLSLLGAVRWGLVLRTPQRARAQTWNAQGGGVVPALLGWHAVLLAAVGLKLWLVLAFLIGDLALCRLMDSNLLRMYADVPSWIPSRRMRLTLDTFAALPVALFSSH
jgi:hypothetical protein